MEKNDLTQLLRANPYPGRGILLGRSADGLYAVAAYFIMGRSENSRNRVFVETEDGIRTQAHDPCPEEAIDLVVVHELCHILEKNHGPRFYALLARYLPDWAERKKLLR